MAAIDEVPGLAFERYAGEVYGWAYRVLGHHHDALDVVQDVFLKWHAQCARQSPTQPRGWLRRVTLNRAIDVRRRRSVSTRRSTGPPERTVSGDVNGVLAGSAAGPESMHAGAGLNRTQSAAIEREELRSEITAALNELTDMQRSVLVAKVFDELTFALIAEETGLSVPTVKTHYLRAVRAVRDRLRPHWADEEKS